MAFTTPSASPPHALVIRPAKRSDEPAIWEILQPVIAAGETYPLPRDWTRTQALGYWLAPAHHTFVAEAADEVLGTYYLRPNHQGGGAHVANCGYMVSPLAQGKGVARAMCAHSLDEARRKGFKGMQFNFVIASNERAVRLWASMGFETLGRLPGVFEHPRLGPVDALIMFQTL